MGTTLVPTYPTFQYCGMKLLLRTSVDCMNMQRYEKSEPSPRIALSADFLILYYKPRLFITYSKDFSKEILTFTLRFRYLFKTNFIETTNCRVALFLICFFIHHHFPSWTIKANSERKSFFVFFFKFKGVDKLQRKLLIAMAV